MATAPHSHDDPLIITVTLDDEAIEATPEHPFLVLLKGWVPAVGLREGDAVRRADGSYGLVKAVAVAADPQTMYTITLADAHTFCVGDDGWMVHNINSLRSSECTA